MIAMTIEQDKKEARRIHDAVISHYTAVLSAFEERRKVLQDEIDRWSKKLRDLENDYAVAPERIRNAQRGIEELNKLEEQAQRAPVTTKKSRFAKILALEAEIARLKREL